MHIGVMLQLLIISIVIGTISGAVKLGINLRRMKDNTKLRATMLGQESPKCPDQDQSTEPTESTADLTHVH